MLIRYLQFFLFVFFLYLGAIALVRSCVDEDRNYMIGLVSISFFLNLNVTFLMTEFLRYTTGSPFVPSVDVENFARLGWQIARFGDSVFDTGVAGIQDAPGIYVLNAFFYEFFGHNTLIIRGFFIFLVALIVLLSYKTAKLVFGRKVGKVTGFLVAVYPNFFVYTLIPHKEVPVSLLILATFWFILLGIREFEFSGFLFSALAMGLLYWFRPEMVVILLPVLLFYVVYKRLGTSWTQKAFVLLGVILILTSTGIYISQTVPGAERGLSLLSPWQLQAELEKIKQGHEVKSGGIGDYLLQASFAERLVFGMPFMLNKPFPPWKSLDDFTHSTFTTPGTMVWYLILPLAIFGLIESFRNFRKDYVIPLLVSGLTLAASALVWGAITARYRVQVMPFLLMFAGLGFCVKKSYKKVFGMYMMTFIGGVVLYLVLKTFFRF